MSTVAVQPPATGTAVSGRLPCTARIRGGRAVRSGRRRPATGTRSASSAFTAVPECVVLRPVRRNLPARRTRSSRRLSSTSCGHSTTGASAPAAGDRTAIASTPVRMARCRLSANPVSETMGDCRWTPDLLVSTWAMAETGRPPGIASGERSGGFRRRLRPPAVPLPGLASRRPLRGKTSRRSCCSIAAAIRGRRIEIDVPWYGGGMSFGSTNIRALLGKARVAKAFNRFTCTGEGGYPERFIPYQDHVITQVATGSVRRPRGDDPAGADRRVQVCPGGQAGAGRPPAGRQEHARAWRPCARRSSGVSLFSPFPFHSVYSVEDHKKHLDWIAHVNPRALLSAKVSTPADVDMVAVGIYYAGGHIVHLDGSYGGTGAAPNIAKKNIAMPIEYAIGRVHQFLVDEGIRDKITVIASGGIRDACRCRQGDRHGRRRMRDRHGGTGGPGLHPMQPPARADADARAASRRPTTNCWRWSRRVVHPAAGEFVRGLAADAGGHPVSPGTRLRERPAGTRPTF